MCPYVEHMETQDTHDMCQTLIRHMLVHVQQHSSHACPTTLKSHMSKHWLIANDLYIGISQLLFRHQSLDLNELVLELITLDDDYH